MSLPLDLKFCERIWDKYFQAMGRDGSYLLLGKVIQMGNGFVISVYLIKAFGLEAVGTYTLASVGASVIAFLSGCGLNHSLPRKQAANPERNTISVVILFFTLPMAIFLTVIFAWFMGRDAQEIWEISIFSVMGYLFAQANIINMLLLLQNRIRFSLIIPIVNSVGTVLGIVYAQNLFHFGLFLVFSRLAGHFIVFSTMQYKKTSLSVILEQANAGARFLPMDIMSQFSEQLISFILAILLPRAELGIFGLCRQVLYTAITPGWSQIDASYPQLVSSRLENAPALKERNKVLSNLATILVISGSFVLGFFIYKIPEFWFMCIVLALSIPARYLNYFYDKVLRAMGQIRSCNYLTFARILLSLAIFPIFISLLQLWGAILGWVLLSLTSVILWGRAAQPFLPKRPIEAAA